MANYNSEYTGQQVDEAVGRVIEESDSWSQAAEDAQNAAGWINNVEEHLGNLADSVATREADGGLNIQQSRVVLLKSMSSSYVNSATVGDIWYSGAFIMRKYTDGANGEAPKKNVLYIDTSTGYMYQWNGSSMVEVAIGGGNMSVSIQEASGTFFINISNDTPSLNVSKSSISLRGDEKTATFMVVGTNLNGDVSISVNNAGFLVSPSSISKGSGSINTSVTVTYVGDEELASATISISSSGAATQQVSVSYADVVEPTLSVSPSMLNLESAVGSAATGTIVVKGKALESAVTLASSSADFELSTNSISAADINAAGTTGVAVTVTRKASASASNATITATSGSLSASASVAWSEAVVEETPSDGDTIVKAGIYYKVLSAASGSTPGTLMLINPDYDNSDRASTYSGNFDVPSSITYANGQYTVIKIGQRAFRNGTVSSVHIPSTINEIKQSAFYGCSSLTTVTFDEGSLNNGNSAALGQQAFASTGLKGTLTLPSTLKLTDQNAFNSTNIKIDELIIGETGLNENVGLNLKTSFYPNCKIDKITIHKTVPPTTGNGTFFSDYILNNADVYVPLSALAEYTDDDSVWKHFADNGRLFTF